jgi:hypothetical protein
MTTFKSILNEYGKGGEVLGLVVGYSGEASSDVHRVADLVATRLSSKHLEYARTSKSIAKAMQTQRICRAWGLFFARGFARVILDQGPGPQLEETVLNGLFPTKHPPFSATFILIT